MKRQVITADRVFGAVCILIGILCIKECIRMYRFASSFLSGDHIVMGIAGGVLILLGIKNKERAFSVEFPEENLAKRMIGVVLVLILYAISLDKLGFAISTALWGIFGFDYLAPIPIYVALSTRLLRQRLCGRSLFMDWECHFREGY